MLEEFLYFFYIQDSAQEKYLKIGITAAGCPMDRLKSLQTGNPFKLRILKVFKIKTDRLKDSSAKKIEKAIHSKMDNSREIGEWFSFDASAKQIIDEVFSELKDFEFDTSYLEKKEISKEIRGILNENN